jgi:hypothetical protein
MYFHLYKFQISPELDKRIKAAVNSQYAATYKPPVDPYKGWPAFKIWLYNLF